MARPSAVIFPVTDSSRSARQPAESEPIPVVPALTPIAPNDLAPVIRSKIQPPVVRQATLTRRRLFARLDEATRQRVTLVVAEAGYGKTTLLADYTAQTRIRTLWYRLDSTDADPITWTNYLVAAGREHAPDFGRATTALLAQISTASPPNNVIVASVIQELNELGDEPTLLILDDFHAVDSSADARAFVERLVRDAPKWLHFVIASRLRPTFHLGRLEANGDLAQLSTDDLRFSLPETERLFAEAYGSPLEPDVLKRVGERTRGWAASLQLFHGSIRGKPTSAIRSLSTSLSGASSPLYDYLAEEFFSNLAEDLDEFLIRASVLDRISAGLVVALFADDPGTVDIAIAERWIEASEQLGLLSRTSLGSETRQLHPLLREFLRRRLDQRMAKDAILQMHLRVATAVEASDSLLASRHYLEAGHDADAMRCLGSSVLLTMGSGQWGAASDLVDRLNGVPAEPAVAALRARKLIEQGDLEHAATILESVDISKSRADVRAVVRHARISLGWRTGDRDLMFTVLDEITRDPETPAILAQIFQVFLDGSSASETLVPFPVLAHRLELMSDEQAKAGHAYYAAISLHNAAQTYWIAGRAKDGWELGLRALESFDRIHGADGERYSTFAVMANCAFELGDIVAGEERLRAALSSDRERGEVHAETAYTLATIGEQARASQLLLTSADLEREGLSDVTGQLIATFAQALLLIPKDSREAIALLDRIPAAMPLDMGYDLERRVLLALSLLVAGDLDAAIDSGSRAQVIARGRASRRSEVRLNLVLAMASLDARSLRDSISAAADVGDMSLLTTADALGTYLWLIPEGPEALRRSISRWPRRWLPILRRQLEQGGTANAAVAAGLLDQYGESTDVGLLRAFARTYRRQLKGSSQVGKELAKRVAPRLLIGDLGRGELVIGERRVFLGAIRRKSAALLVFLITRPGHSSTRDQALEELWPESDPVAASNNLNQALYYLRREIDPWYDDDVSLEYVCFQSDLLWLDPSLTTIASAEFASEARALISGAAEPGLIRELIGRYQGQFAPEFEYEEWTIAWRTRVHALFLQVATNGVTELIRSSDLSAARDLVLDSLSRDPEALELERKLVWLYWRMGSRSAAEAQFAHLTAMERADGLEPTSFDSVIGPNPP